MKTPTLRTKLADAPDDTTREIIKLLRKMKVTQSQIHKLFKDDSDK